MQPPNPPMPATSCPPHWWELPESNGPVSVGVCRYCDETREFSNSGEPTSHFKVMGKVGLEKKHRKDGGDYHARGDRVLEPRLE